MARTLRPVIIGLAVLIVVVLAASSIAVAWFWRERQQVRELLAAEKGQPTEVVLKRMLRQRVHRDEKKIFVNMTKDQIQNAPDYDPARHKKDEKGYHKEVGEYYEPHVS